MQADDDVVNAMLPPGASVRALVKPGQDYLVYVRTGLGDWKKNPDRKVKFDDRELTLPLNLPAGSFVAEWFDTRRCSSLASTQFTHTGGARVLRAPAFEEDLALTVRRK